MPANFLLIGHRRGERFIAGKHHLGGDVGERESHVFHHWSLLGKYTLEGGHHHPFIFCTIFFDTSDVLVVTSGSVIGEMRVQESPSGKMFEDDGVSIMNHIFWRVFFFLFEMSCIFLVSVFVQRNENSKSLEETLNVPEKTLIVPGKYQSCSSIRALKSNTIVL